MNLRIGKIGVLLAPGYGQCKRCKTPWKFVQDHSTMYGDGHGCFPLCQKCWAELTPKQRLPFYRTLIEYWHARHPGTHGLSFEQEWALVEVAVLTGG